MDEFKKTKKIKSVENFKELLTQGYICFVGNGRKGEWNNKFNLYIHVIPTVANQDYSKISDDTLFFVRYNFVSLDYNSWRKDCVFSSSISFKELTSPENVIGWFLKNGELRGFERRYDFRYTEN
jgi:hypothetical protein